MQNVANYELINTQNTATNADDSFVNPTSAVYNSTTNMVKLTFAAGQVSSAGTYRLRVGNNDPLPVTPTSINVASNPATYPGDTLSTSYNLGNFGSGVATGTQQSLVVTGAEITNQSATGINNLGNVLDPGHRDIPLAIEDSVPAGSGGGSIAVVTYAFPTVYGNDPISGSPLYNQITAQQEEDAEAIFALYSKYLGVQFELVSSGADINVVTGDPRVLAPTLTPSAVGGIEAGGLAIVNAFDDWSGTKSEYGGAWMTTAMHEIGHALGYLHDDASPPLTIMNGGAEGPSGNGGITTVPGLPAAEPVFPGDIDIANGQYIIQPNANDINMYQFNLTQSGTVSLQTIAQRLSSASLLDSVLTVFDSSGNKIASNDNYYGSDSFLQLDLPAGTYYIGVTSVGNTNYNPLVPESGSGGTSQGAYDLQMTFQPDAVSGLVSASSSAYPNGVPFDGQSNGQPGSGAYNFWFQVQTAANTVYVDKANGQSYTGTGSLGSITNPYNNIATALAATTAGDVVRIVGNSKAQTNDAYAYNIGYNVLNQTLSDGSTMAVPKGVTVMIDNGGTGSTAVFKLAKANISVGSISQGINLANGALQVLGTPSQNVIFTSYNDQSVAPVTNPLVTTPSAGGLGRHRLRGRRRLRSQRRLPGQHRGSHAQVRRRPGRGEFDRTGVRSHSPGRFAALDPVQYDPRQRRRRNVGRPEQLRRSAILCPAEFADQSRLQRQRPDRTRLHGRLRPHGPVDPWQHPARQFDQRHVRADSHPGRGEPRPVDRAGHLRRHGHYLRADRKPGNRRAANHVDRRGGQGSDQRRAAGGQRRGRGRRQPGDQSRRGGQAGRRGSKPRPPAARNSSPKARPPTRS